MLKDINLEILKGEKVAITGISGSGKSTLLDIIMGFHFPKNGKIFGDVKATAIQMNGYVEGDIDINGTAELLSNCELVGDLRYKVLNIQDGAQFSGRCEIINSEVDSD